MVRGQAWASQGQLPDVAGRTTPLVGLRHRTTPPPPFAADRGAPVSTVAPLSVVHLSALSPSSQTLALTPVCLLEPLPSRGVVAGERTRRPLRPALPLFSVLAMARPSWRSLNPITRTGGYFARLIENFGWRFILILLSSYVGVRGVAHRLVLSAYLPYMRIAAGVTNASLYQAYYTVLNLPWSLKATVGVLSDVLPVGGYHKRYYIIGSVVLGSTACAVLAGAPITTIGGGVTAAVLLFFLSFEVATGTWTGEAEGRGAFARGRRYATRYSSACLT